MFRYLSADIICLTFEEHIMSKVEFWVRGGYGVEYFSKICEQVWEVEKITGILLGFS